MHGVADFCEVFTTDDVRIPVKNVVGEVNAGWSLLAMATQGSSAAQRLWANRSRWAAWSNT